MKRVFLCLLFLITVSCSLSEKKVYNNLYVANGGELYDYPVAAIKLDNGDQLNIFPFEVKDYRIENKYVIFKCIDYYGDEIFYLLDKNFDEYNYEEKITGPMNTKEFESFQKREKLNIKW
ncbi:hypothetical protein [Chryseobacterium sp. YIM B08800]|uniref:hypothetical protein n=1 Tax=Chryseobacterium sp. YIM B08800 TaxID=2984136 RepID=UPI0022403D14|nr:hypothetical protein [Chryseobacterium sp. YIM B08800]